MKTQNLVVLLLVTGILCLVGAPSLSKLLSKQRVKANQSVIHSINEISYNQQEEWEIELPKVNFPRTNILLLDPVTLEDLEIQVAVANLIKTKANFSKLKDSKPGKRIPLKKNKFQYSSVLINPEGVVFGIKDKKKSRLVGFTSLYYTNPETFQLPHDLTVSLSVNGSKLKVKKLNNYRSQVLVKINDQKVSYGHLINLLAANIEEEAEPKDTKILPVQEDDSSQREEDSSELPEKVEETLEPITSLPTEEIAPESSASEEDQGSTIGAGYCGDHICDQEEVYNDSCDDYCAFDCGTHSSCQDVPPCVVGGRDENGEVIESCCGNGTVEEKWETQGDRQVNVGEQCDNGGGVDSPDDSEDCVGCRLKCEIELEMPETVIENPGNTFNVKIIPKSKADILKTELEVSPPYCRDEECYNSLGNVSSETLTGRISKEEINKTNHRVSNFLWYGLSENNDPKDPELCSVIEDEDGLSSKGRVDRQGMYTVSAQVEFNNGCVASNSKRIRVVHDRTNNYTTVNFKENRRPLRMIYPNNNGSGYCVRFSCSNNDCMQVIAGTPVVELRHQYRSFAEREENGHNGQSLGTYDWNSGGGYRDNGVFLTDWTKFSEAYGFDQPICLEEVQDEDQMKAEADRLYDEAKTKFHGDLGNWAIAGICWREYTIKRTIDMYWQRAGYHYHCSKVLGMGCPAEEEIFDRKPDFFWDWLQGGGR